MLYGILSFILKNFNILFSKKMEVKNEYKDKKAFLNKRNHGLDLLRIISMIHIINLHINLYSGFLASLKYNLPQFKPIWRLQAFSRWSVNCFGLISGVVGYKKTKFSNLIYIWITVLFYSIIISLYMYHKNSISKKDFYLSFFPILIRRHWYFNAYFQMYLLLPFINKGIECLEKKTYKKIVLIFIFLYSFYHIFGVCIGKNNSLFLNDGYSGMWLTIIYIIGAYFGKYIFIDINKLNILNYIFYIIFLLNYISCNTIN